MKKLSIAALLVGSLFITACSSGVNDVKPVENKNIKEVCLKGAERKAPDDFVDALSRSLSKKNIKSHFIKGNEKCDYVLVFGVKGNAKIIARARLDLRDMNNGKQSIGSVSYKRRGDEIKRVKQVGLQGQTDAMVNELFKNY